MNIHIQVTHEVLKDILVHIQEPPSGFVLVHFDCWIAWSVHCPVVVFYYSSVCHLFGLRYSCNVRVRCIQRAAWCQCEWTCLCLEFHEWIHRVRYFLLYDWLIVHSNVTLWWHGFQVPLRVSDGQCPAHGLEAVADIFRVSLEQCVSGDVQYLGAVSVHRLQEG